jgi:hypothetical protein
MRLHWYHGLVLLLGLLVLGGAALLTIDAFTYHRVGFAGTNVPGHMAANYHYLDDTIDSSITAGEGETIVLDYELHTEQGHLQLSIRDPQGERLMHLEGNDVGRAEIEAPFDGTYRLIIHGEETRGGYDLRWYVAPETELSGENR